MALDTYTDLQASIIRWAFRTGDAEFAAEVPNFIAGAEETINNKLRVREMEATATITLVDGAGDLPADYLQHRRIKANVSPGSVLEMVTPDYADENYPENGAAYPRYFTIIGSTIKTYPTSSGNLSLTYYQKLALSDVEPTNWLIVRAPKVYRYGALAEASTYMLDDAGVQKNMALFLGALKDLQDADAGARYARAVSRVSGPTP